MNIEKVNDEKYKSIFISYNFTMDLENSKQLSKNALIAALMQKSSKKYKDLKEIEDKLSMLYGADFDISVDKYGDIYNFQFKLNFINKKFLPNNEDIKDEALEFLFDMIYNPKDWDEKQIEREKTFIIEKINERKDEKISYALQKMEEILSEGEPYGTFILGKIDEIKNITKDELVEQYKKIINSAVTVIVVGNLSGYENIDKDIEEKFGKYVTSNNSVKDFIADKTKLNLKEHAKENIFEKQDGVQSALALGGYIKDIKEKDYFALAIFNAILGVTPISKLFQNVREKASLCYKISSKIYKLKGLIIVYAGVNGKNCNKTAELINNQLEDIKEGNFSNEDLKYAIDNTIAILNEIQESKSLTCTYKLSNMISYKRNISIEECENRYKEVTREDVINIAKKIELCKEFIIGGEQDA